MLPTNGFLRESVLVDSNSSGVELRFSVWSIELPRSLLESSKKISAFFRREISSSALNDESDHVRNLLALLSYQGCLVPECNKDVYQLEEIKALYISFCNESYGRYYAHNLWASMRADVIPVSTIRQWISRTYFLSRFAGVTASAASQNGPTHEIRSAFLKSAVEEYSHCEDYYLPPSALFSSDLGYTKGIAPAPCFVAFDQQMLRIAQEDWLAHLFIALFQERTAQFKDGAHRLYLRVEEQLGMPGMLDGWRTHISFDEENSHEDDLGRLFEQQIEIPYEQLQDAFDEASLTVDLLIDGLDTVLHLGKSGINPRACAVANLLKSCHLEGVRSLLGVSDYTIKARTPSDLVTEITRLIEITPAGLSFLSTATVLFHHQIECCSVAHLTRCLENCETHDQVISIGKILETAIQCGLKYEPVPSALKKANRVVWNYFAYKTKRPSEFTLALFLLFSLLEAASRQSRISLELLGPLKEVLNVTVQKLCSSEMSNEYLNETLSSLAMLEYACELACSDRLPVRFALGHNTAHPGMPASGRH